MCWCEFVLGLDQNKTKGEEICLMEWKRLTIERNGALVVSSTVYPEWIVLVLDLMCVRWWRDVPLFATSTVSIDDSSETDWRWKWLDSSLKNGNACTHHTHSETSQPTVRQCNSFPFASTSFCSLSFAINVSFGCYSCCCCCCCCMHTGAKECGANNVTVPSTFVWMVHMNRYSSKLFWIVHLNSLEVFDNNPVWWWCCCWWWC